MTNNESATTDALTAIISALTPLTSDERQRVVGAAMLFLGEMAPKQHRIVSIDAADNDGGDSGGDYSPHIIRWMKQNGVSAEELDRAFHFNDGGTFDLLHAPGKSKKEQTLNTYILTGLGKYLTTKERAFDDGTARGFCETIGCYDPANHAVYIKNSGPEFTGDKRKGFSLTNIGLKQGAVLVKEITGG
jgi:hypothetical protein